jgi:hypothetical protein
MRIQMSFLGLGGGGNVHGAGDGIAQTVPTYGETHTPPPPPPPPPPPKKYGGTLF